MTRASALIPHQGAKLQCATLGTLVLGARFIPRIFGVLLKIGGGASLAGTFVRFLKRRAQK